MEDMKIIKGTLQENILLGRKDLGTEDILELSEKMGIEHLSSQFTNGFYTELSETDTEISFSSKKKILLLRALLGNHRLLLLEDPLDGMNGEFKLKMLAFLQELKKKTTIVIVSDDPELMNIADQQLYLQDGKVTSNLPNRI